MKVGGGIGCIVILGLGGSCEIVCVGGGAAGRVGAPTCVSSLGL